MGDQGKRTVRRRAASGSLSHGRAMLELFFIAGKEVTGDEANGTASEPSVMYSWPQTAEKSALAKQLLPLCLPNRNIVRVLRRTPSDSDLQRVMFGHQSLRRSPACEVFIMTREDGGRLFGCCVPGEVVHRLGRNGELLAVKRTMCVLSTGTGLECLFAVLFRIAAAEREWRITSSVSQAKGGDSESDPLLASIPVNLSGQSLESSVSSWALPVLEALSSQCWPLNSGTIRHTTGMDFGASALAGSDLLALADWALPVMCRALPLPLFVRVALTLLTEPQMVVHCGCPGIRSAIVLSVLALVRPLVWAGAAVTTLSSEMLLLLQAPTPFVAGIENPPPVQPEGEDELTVLHVDDGELVNSPIREPLQGFMAAVHGPFRALRGTHADRTNPISFVVNDDDRTAARELCSIMHSFVRGLLLTGITTGKSEAEPNLLELDKIVQASSTDMAPLLQGMWNSQMCNEWLGLQKTENAGGLRVRRPRRRERRNPQGDDSLRIKHALQRLVVD